MGGSGSPSMGIYEIEGNTGDLPANWFPNSRIDLRNPITGQRTQQRWFGPDGRAVRDRDWSHGNRGGSHRFPHDHRWVDGRRIGENLPIDVDFY